MIKKMICDLDRRRKLRDERVAEIEMLYEKGIIKFIEYANAIRLLFGFKELTVEESVSDS